MTQNPPGYFGVPLLRYTGAKWKLADWVIAQFPPHDLYCEPYCGSAALFFRKPVSSIEVLNDVYSTLINFFRVLRERPDDLINLIELTPFSREEYLLAYEPTDDPLEAARRFYVLSWQSFGAFAGRKSGWRFQRNTHRGTGITREWKRLDGLKFAVERLRDAQLENRPALEVIADYDNPTSLFYVDPPYVLFARTEGSRKRYMHEMTDDDHRQLAVVLHDVKGMVVLSGYDSSLYRELYPDWRMLTKTTTTNGNSTAEECLWISPHADQRWQEIHPPLPTTLPMFTPEA